MTAATRTEQRDSLRALADRIERGEPVGAWDVSLLRSIANSFPTDEPRPVGAPRKLNYDDMALLFYAMHYGAKLSKNRAHEHVAQAHQCSINTVKNAIKLCGERGRSGVLALGLTPPRKLGSNSR